RISPRRSGSAARAASGGSRRVAKWCGRRRCIASSPSIGGRRSRWTSSSRERIPTTVTACSRSSSARRAPAWAAKGTVTFADVGVGDPCGDWSKFSGPTGWDVKLVAIGNAPSTVLNVLIAGGGAQIYDIVNIVGGMQKPLVENNLIEAID